ncbi:MAG: SCP-like extracellular [Desulfuromonas sp.]|nr:SCP-like extracellular [Desulfuromonas sp.]
MIFAAVCTLLFPVAALALEPRQQREIVLAHNQWRAAVGVPDLVWSERLAALASAWANRLKEQNACEPVHNPDNGRNRTGENIFWASPVIWSDGRKEPQEIAPAAVVDDWAGESRDYHYADNSCASGKMCGHYTQVVWKGSREVGCGYAVCRDGAQVWVCNYSPPGNFVGQRPY